MPKICQKLETRTKASCPILPLPLDLDLTGKEVYSAVSFFRVIREKIQSQLTELFDIPLEVLPAPAEGQPLAPTFQRVLEGWNQALMSTQGRHLRLILLLDECEHIVEQAWATELYEALRFLLVGQSTRSLFKVVMAGSHRFLTEVHQLGSPLHNIFVEHKLCVLDSQATRDLIIQPTEDVLSDEVVQAVVKQTGGHPFLTQYVMYHLWEPELEQTTPETLQQIVATFPHKRNEFKDWLRSLGDFGSKIYRVLSQNDTPLTERDIQAALNPTHLDWLQALDALCYHGLVIREADGQSYRIAGQMFHDWFMANITEEDASLPEIDLNTLRQQLNQKFDDPELDAFCMTHFPEVQDKFGRGMGKDEKLNLLLDHCRRVPTRYEQLLVVLEE